MYLYTGKQMRGEVVGHGWVFVEWLYPGQNKYTAFKELREIEAQIKQEHFRGWYAKSEKEHTMMHKFLSRFEATLYKEDDHDLYFKKEVI
jgi:hypothetical protein